MKRPIPAPPDPSRVRFDQAIKENIEIITGQRGEPLKTLPSTATLADVLAKVNQIIERLQ